jgi:uncharacterized membrane protein
MFSTIVSSTGENIISVLKLKILFMILTIVSFLTESIVFIIGAWNIILKWL